jgi:hypothetical protein
LERKSNVIDKRNPQSVSCGLVYYYLRRLNVDITPAKFGELVGLSAITITNITIIILFSVLLLVIPYFYIYVFGSIYFLSISMITTNYLFLMYGNVENV